MELDSYLEIFTTMYGWAFANIIGEAFSSTGLVIVPFMLIIFNEWREAQQSGVQSGGVVALINSVSTQLVIAMFVYSVCFATSSVTSLLNVNLYFTPAANAANPAPQTVSRDGGTGTTFDTALANSFNGTMSSTGNLSYVPAWWYTVPGFAIDFNRDAEYYNPASGIPAEQGVVNPEWGRPTCEEWWVKLREDMISSSTIWQQMTSMAGNMFSFNSVESVKDQFAKLASAKADPSFVDIDRVMPDNYDKTTTVGQFASKTLGSLGVAGQALGTSFSMPALIEGLPMAQALILMGLYMFMPLMVLFSGYDLKSMLIGTIALFTVKFFAVIWAIALWVDAGLINAMYPGMQGNIILRDLTHASDQSYKRMLLNILLMFMMLGLPLLWISMMAWIGHRVHGGLSDMLGKIDNTAQSAGKSTTGIASAVAKAAVNVATKVVK
ncbi:MAG: conjugal transfer protein TraG N-terminal domain-containing protein [Rhodoferax sp.]|nr:conjugal transfer protein TraG N-terminal domain-containing protein [Rhodoferax sp.]